MPYDKTIRIVVAVIVLGSQSLLTHGQRIERLHKHSSQILIDGRVDEAIWEQIEPLHISQKVPDAGAPPTQKTEIRITYDDENIYLSGRMYDAEPEKIVANSKKRDDFTENTEWCGFLIDSYDDRENALAFYVTPTGSKLDMAISNDAQGGNAINVSWNAFWEAASTITDEGWFAEIKVPFKNLPFNASAEQVIMGITAWRYYARNDETDIYPPRDLTTGSSFRPSLTQLFAFEGISRGNPVFVTPYVLAGATYASSIGETNERYAMTTAYKKEAGLDVKIGLGSSATMDLTINTDFAQVEVDDQQVNLTRFNVFFPEKRLFFQERASLFDFNFGTTDKVFYSRRIGISNGRPTRIYGGVRSFGRFGKWETGLISLQAASESDNDSENFTVFRVRKRVLNENSTIGAILTNRATFGQAHNTVYGLDATLRLYKQNFFSLRWAQSFDNSNDFDALSLSPSKFYLEVARRSLQGFTYNLNFGRAGNAYRPGMGFEQREDFSRFNYRLAYYTFPAKESKVLQYGPYFQGNLIWGNSTGLLESRNIDIGFEAFSKSGWYWNVQSQPYREILPQNLTLPGEIVLAPGEYNFHSVSASVTSPSAFRFSFSTRFNVGGFYNGQNIGVTLAPFFNLTPDISLEGTYQYNRLDFLQKENPVEVRLAQLKVLYTINTKLAISTFIQHNNLLKRFLNGFRLRYNPRDGNDFYFVYNGDLNHDRDRMDPALPLTTDSTFILKYSHTFHL